MANEINPRAVADASLAEVGYQGSKYDSKFTRFLDSVNWYCAAKAGATTWCCIADDYFVAICKGDLSYDQARQIVCEPANSKINYGAGVKEKVGYYKEAGRFIPANQVSRATTGDEVFFYKSGSNEPGHVGRLVDWDSKYIYTVEGSTTYDGKSNCLGKKSYPFKSSRIYGFGRPDWYKYQRADAPAPAPDPKPSNNSGYTDAEIKAAYDCIEGYYGNGKTRANNLQQAGFDYYRVQGLVNKILKGEFKK